jgi:ribosome-associated translation inhibitor RaiA
MIIDIKARNVSLTHALRGYVLKRIKSSLTGNNDHIQRIVVRLSDINGPKGGIDKRCHIQVVIPHRPDVVIDNVESSLFAAVDIAANRAGRTVSRCVAKLRKHNRTMPRIDSTISFI